MNGRTSETYPGACDPGSCERHEDALTAVVAHYQKYIRVLATKPLKDEYGNTYLYVDEDMRLRIETKLIHGIVTGFQVLSA